MSSNNNQVLKAVLMAVLATLIWSGNFIVARGISTQVPPVSLAFFRWLTATVVISVMAMKHIPNSLLLLKQHWKYLLLVAFFGITTYNTLIYVAGHYIPAINLALIGTTSSPVFSIILAAIILKEHISTLKLTGLLLCIAGILVLLSKGSLNTLIHFHFSPGDWWILTAAFMFAVYNILVRKKPSGIGSLPFLWTTFVLGTLMLLPAFIAERSYQPAINWSPSLVMIVLYLGIGNSVICYLLWNFSISHLGAGRTALFGNLIPLFSSIEALIILKEKISWIHGLSAVLVISGLVLANLAIKKPPVSNKF